MIDLFSEFNRIIEKFQSREVAYSVVGAFAVAVYGGARATQDMDFLLLSEDEEKIRAVMRELGYTPNQPWKFENTEITLLRFLRASGESEDHYLADILLADSERFREIIRKSHEEPWARGFIRVARLKDLIWMKSLRDSHTDRADIEFLKNIHGSRNDESGKGDL